MPNIIRRKYFEYYIGIKTPWRTQRIKLNIYRKKKFKHT